MTSEIENSVFVDAKDRTDENLDDILSRIETNLNSNEDNSISGASDEFKALLHTYDDKIPLEIYRWAKANCEENIRNILVDKLKNQITDIVNDDPMKLITIIPTTESEDDRKYIVDFFMGAVDSLSDEIVKTILNGFVIPGMFNAAYKDQEIHNMIIDFGFQLITIFPITKLGPQEVKTWISGLIEQHIKVLEKWREENFNRWHELWMFLVRFSGRYLHTSMDLANKLLRIVEFAFRNHTYEQRVKGYDCWKELIDNASLNMKHMTSNKQIKLLVTPLRAKFSKMEVVICKRFEVFFYLIEKLQGNSVLCLNEFLEFCFGVSNTSLRSKNGQGKLVPSLWLRSVQVFIAILGDQSFISKEFNRTIFERAIINENNIDRFDQVVVYSVIESCTILKFVPVNLFEKIELLESLWKVFFNILVKSSGAVQEKCFSTIFTSSSLLFKDFNEDVTYLSLLNAFLLVLNSSVDYIIYRDFLKLIIENFISFLNEGTVLEDLYEQFEQIFMNLCKNEHSFELLTEQLRKLEASKNEEMAYKLWKELEGNTKDGESKSTVSIILWPVFHLNKCAKFANIMCTKWTELFSQMSDSNKKLIMNELDKAFKSNPLLTYNISTIISFLDKRGMSLENDIGESMLKLMSSIMSLPLLSEETAEKLFPMILKCLKLVVAKDPVDLESVENICQCLQKIPSDQKNSDLLDLLENLVKKMVQHANTNTGKKLKNLMSTFSSTKLQKKALKISTLLSPEVINSPTSNVKRSIRMTQMVFVKEGLTPNKEKIEALQLFGKDVETFTPLKAKSSILQNSASANNSRSKRVINSVRKSFPPNPPIYDEQTCEFVVIDTEVKLQKDMLTDHQKEKLRQRREDIPALYQDLSQSQTQSSLSTDTQSNHADNVDDKSENEEKAMKNPEEESMDCQKLEITEEEKPVNDTIETLRKQEENDTNVDSSDESGNKKVKKLAKSERELLRIQMDIVGGKSFIQNLPSKRPRKVNEKVTTPTPKKSKKLDRETITNDKNQNSVQSLESSTRQNETETGVIGNSDQRPQGISDISPVVVIENIPSISSSLTSDVDTDSSSTPNRRKNKLMKPIKNFDSPSSEKRKNKLERKGTPGPKRKLNEPKEKTKKRKSTSETSSEDPQSEILFESEMNQETEARGRQMRDKPRKNVKTESQEDKVNMLEEGDQTPSKEVAKPKKTPKELMKKNKEKVRTIQSQLRLADLSNLDVTSPKNKSKNAKLIFIRELTNPKNPQDTKVSPAGLRRNKDNKSKNIAYTIETPSTSVNISSLVHIDDIQPSCSKVMSENSEKAKPKKRRRKTIHEDRDVTTDSSPPESQKRKSKTRKFDKSPDQNDIGKIEESADADSDTKNMEVQEPSSDDKESVGTSRKSLVNVSSESSLFSPESPSRSTRSRTNSPMNTGQSPQLSPKGVRTLFKDSEDIIESSQGSPIENSSISFGNMSRSRLRQSPKVQNGGLDSEAVESIPNGCETGESQNLKVDKPISQATTLTCESNYEALPPVVQVEVPEKLELSDSEKLLSMADTVSMESTEEIEKKDDREEGKSDEPEKSDLPTEEEDGGSRSGSPVPIEVEINVLGTPQRNNDNLPGSPVSRETPTFKKELLDNTVDISPIGSLSSDSDDKMTTEIIAALDAALGEKSEPESATVSKSSEDSKSTSVVFSSNERSNKLLNMVNVESPVSSHRKSNKRKISSPLHRKSRYEKLFSFCQKNVDTAIKEEDPTPSTENTGDILTFSREVPSPLAVPSSSILKRKLADTDDSYSPCPKRKRVNFSYPCITSTKLFIRHRDELNTHYRPTFASNLFDDEPPEGESEEEDPFADPESYGQVGSEESMDITDSLSLCSNKPIDERLVNCVDNLDSLWKRLSSPTYCDKLKNLLKSKNIQTIGDLASLNEIEINRLPFRDPKVKTVRKALFYYFNNVFKISENKEEQIINTENVSTSSEEVEDKQSDLENGGPAPTEEINNENIEVIAREPETLKDEVRMVIKKIKDKDTSLEEFGDVFIDLVDESQLISLLHNVYNTNFRQFFGRPHWRYLIENIVKSGGTSELFDIISDLAENNKVFAEQLEHIVQLRIDQDPLKNILKKKTLVQVGAALQECIEEGEFQKENVLQMCLMPLIKSPSDIRNYFNSLTIVQIHDLFIERVQPSDLTCFLDQIREHYGNYTIAQCANKKDVLKICSKEDLAVSLIEKENEVGAVKHLISHIGDQSQLLELYNYIGSLLPVKSRIDSHIHLLQSISFDKNVE